MFGRSKPEKVLAAPKPASPGAPMETVLGPTCVIKGVLQGDGTIRVEGIFEGSMEISGNLIIGENARVRAEVRTTNVSVAGMLIGKIHASGRVEILSTGKVWGEINASSLVIDEGGYFRGQSVMPGAEPEFPMLEAPRAEPVEREGRVIDLSVREDTPGA
ncbi:polymer-forming cytoskeletal protein [Thermoflexus sp.]|uniref:bactofilin family protein n=1 Tax=Thermoflexus sp. TaxID=1969742 RepID=UPI0025EBCF06|nr:polymer-forming cytoskeletal protein [Thermoflexus sp.]MDW8181069.1 polymer-forming cytoskeletal protein [Anaerolineae bacterium]MCS6963099.1 polymer-forming cytoskeletal protein [Thermoflexus sp.]MCS7351611.1 polymer-forming cytoskeletal protein [Thermoflexus sp.]MCX7689765.1 polymer-forming cytoskeletal protein [Thermoflexus sp.]MDW8184085.1 polymer-forming cytoskeletal protein [Anaerolineae bacterium]